MLLVPVRGNKLTHSMIYLRAQFMPFIPSSLLESLFFGQRCPSSLFSDRLLVPDSFFAPGYINGGIAAGIDPNKVFKPVAVHIQHQYLI